MARNRWRPCSTPGCPTLVPRAGRCDEHLAAAEQARGNATERGYDAAHRSLRASLLAKLRRAERDGHPAPACRKCGEPMKSSQRLDLGHPEDRALNAASRADELEHSTCNRSAGGRLGAMITNAQ